MATFALLGGSGNTGVVIARALHDANLDYRIVGRSAAFAWDPTDAKSVQAATEGVDTAFYLVGVPYDKFELHPKLMRSVLDGMIAAGVKRVLLIATVYPYGPPQTRTVREDHPRNPNTFKGRMRKEQEDLLLEAHARGQIEAAILRLPDFYGPNVHSSLVWDVFPAALANRRANLVGPIDTPHQFVCVPDVGPLAVALAQEPRAYGHTWHFAGSGTITQREFARRAFEQAGHAEPKLLVANKTVLRVMGLFNPLMRELVEMHYLQTQPVILDDSALRSLLPGVHATPFDEGIAQTLASARTAQHA